MSAELVKADAGQLAQQEPSILQVIQQIAQSPNAKDQIEVMKELLAMQERREDRDSRRQFFEALADAQSELPQIDKMGQGQSNPYARLEDIDAILRPIMKKYGFALSFDEKVVANDQREHTATLSHRGGHSETKSMTLPADKGGNKNGVQAVGSTSSYAQRYLTARHFNVVMKGVDTDGNDNEPIGDEKALDLKSAIEEVKGDLPRFLKHFEIEKLADLRQADYGEALQMIEDKRKAKKP